MKMDFTKIDHLIWLFPVAFAVHFVEEAPSFAEWVNTTLGGSATNQGFVISNMVFMLILIGFCILAAKVSRPWTMVLLFMWVGAQTYGNFVIHFFSQLHFNVYSPGVVSAVFIYNPLYLYIGYQAIQQKRLSKLAFVNCTVLGTFAMFVFAWANIFRFDAGYWRIWFPFLYN